MTITDKFTGNVGSVALANGDGIAAVIARMNAVFATQRMRLLATKSVDNRVQVTASDPGGAAGFTVAYTAGAGGDGTATLGIAAGATVGLNVAGTINGVAATGSGQILVGATGDASEGLSIRYAGSTARAAGTVRYTLGVMGTLSRLASRMASDTGSTSDAQVERLSAQATSFDRQSVDIQARLDARRVALTKQFIAMEAAIAKANAIGTSLSAQITALQAQTR